MAERYRPRHSSEEVAPTRVIAGRAICDPACLRCGYRETQHVTMRFPDGTVHPAFAGLCGSPVLTEVDLALDMLHEAVNVPLAALVRRAWARLVQRPGRRRALRRWIMSSSRHAAA